MNDRNVQCSRGVTLVGGGAPKAQIIEQCIALAPDLVAADGGANHCLAFGQMPRAVIGDFDSLTPETRQRLPDTEFFHVSEQDSTDFEKSLTRLNASFVLANGFTSARVDHTLAALAVLARRVGPPTFLLSDDDVIFAAPRRFEIDLGLATRFSLFPMSRIQGTSRGLKWPIDGLTLDPSGQIGTSNETTGPVSLKFDQPGCLIILPRQCLQPVLAACLGPSVFPAQ